MLTVFLLVSVILASEVGICMADLHKFIYRMTENNSEIRVAADGVAEYYADGEGEIWNEQSISMLPDTNQMDGGSYSGLNLRVEPSVCCITSNFQVEVGQSIDVSAGVQWCWADYCIGILHEDGCVCYVQAEGFVSHIFQIEKAGKYRIFVKNNRTDEAIPYIVINYKLINSNKLAANECLSLSNS